ncbi:MAG: Hsp33 family molecular chaperone HslO [Clostridia bacterium]|nr:Hsp33 family molecular chaperone HslO [Clostridia bacterium]
MKDRLIRMIEKEGHFRAFAIDSHGMVEEARRIHGTSPVVTAGLGRSLSAAAMMGAELKTPQETISVQLKGDGPVGCIVAVSDSDSRVRGYVGEPLVDLPLKPNGKLDVSGSVGHGHLTVVHDLGMKEPYVGRVELQSGEIAEDIAYYYATSQQTPSVVALGVLVDRDYTVKAAGGYIVQLMPDCPEEVVSKLEENVAHMPAVTQMLAEQHTLEEMMEKILQGFSYDITEEREPVYHCNCGRERIERVLISLGKKELLDMAREQNGAEIRCHFCNKTYPFSEDELRELVRKI